MHQNLTYKNQVHSQSSRIMPNATPINNKIMQERIIENKDGNLGFRNQMGRISNNSNIMQIQNKTPQNIAGNDVKGPLSRNISDPHLQRNGSLKGNQVENRQIRPNPMNGMIPETNSMIPKG
jgi:hypothetical protein